MKDPLIELTPEQIEKMREARETLKDTGYDVLSWIMDNKGDAFWLIVVVSAISSGITLAIVS